MNKYSNQWKKEGVKVDNLTVFYSDFADLKSLKECCKQILN